MSKYLIFNLVDQITEKKEKVVNRFNDEDYENTYCLEVYFKKIDFDKIICFGNEESDWAYLYKIMCNKYKKKFEIDDFEFLKEIPDLETVEAIFKDYFGDVMILKYFDQKYDKNYLINNIYDLKNIINNNDIILDFTGGKRYLIILVLQLLLLLRNNINDSRKNNKIEVFNTKYVGKKENDNINIYEIFSLDDFVDKINYIKDMSQFIDFGNPLDILKYLDDKTLRNNIESLYIYSQMNIETNIRNTLEEIYDTLDKTFFPSNIQKIIITTMIKKWYKFLDSKGISDYYRSINNEVYAIINEGDNKKFLRDRLAHPFDKHKRLVVDDLDKNFYIKPSKGKKYLENSVLLTNVGGQFGTNDKIIKKDDDIIKSKFLFKNIEKFDEFKKVFFVTGYYSNWNKIIDDFILECNLTHKRIVDFKEIKKDKEKFKEKLNEELVKLDERFEAIVLDEAHELKNRNRYFEILYDKFKNKNYLVSYDISFGSRESSYLNYLNLYNLESLDIIKIGKIYYNDYNNKEKYSTIYNMDEIKEVLKIFKFFYEFEMYFKYDDTIEISSKLKEIIKKINLVFETNQFRLLDKISNEIEIVIEFDNNLEKELYERIKIIKEKYKDYKTDIEKGLFLVKKNLQYNNIGLSIFLLSDLFRNGLLNQESLNSIKNINYEKMNDYKKEFIHKSKKLGFPELFEFNEKYKKIIELRNKGMHNSQQYVDIKSINKTINKVHQFYEDLKKISKNHKKYTNAFYDFMKEKRNEKK